MRRVRYNRTIGPAINAKYQISDSIPTDLVLVAFVSETPLYVAGRCFTCVGPSQMARPNAYRLMKSPITKSCMRSVLEKQIVRRTNRLIRVRRLMCLLSIFCVCSLPT